MIDLFATTTLETVLSTFSPVVVGLMGCVVLLVAIGIAKGKDILITFLISLYIGTLVTAFFPFNEWVVTQLGVQNPIIVPLLVLGLTTAVAALSLRKYIGSVYQHHMLWRIIEIVVLAVMSTGFLCIAVHNVVGFTSHLTLGPAEFLFTTPVAFSFWLIAPILSFPIFIRPA